MQSTQCGDAKKRIRVAKKFSSMVLNEAVEKGTVMDSLIWFYKIFTIKNLIIMTKILCKITKKWFVLLSSKRPHFLSFCTIKLEHLLKRHLLKQNLAQKKINHLFFYLCTRFHFLPMWKKFCKFSFSIPSSNAKICDWFLRNNQFNAFSDTEDFQRNKFRN